jgi:hypothetical protein
VVNRAAGAVVGAGLPTLQIANARPMLATLHMRPHSSCTGGPQRSIYLRANFGLGDRKRESSARGRDRRLHGSEAPNPECAARNRPAFHQHSWLIRLTKSRVEGFCVVTPMLTSRPRFANRSEETKST